MENPRRVIEIGAKNGTAAVGENLKAASITLPDVLG